MQLNATEQDTLVKQIGLALLRTAPRDWRRITAEYRAVGRYHEMTGEITTNDGDTQEWAATHDIAALFSRLRGGMYRDGRGTWFNARYQLDHPSSYNLEYNRDEPQWQVAPPLPAYVDELRSFPRTEENLPDWLTQRMSELNALSSPHAEQSAPRLRFARIFDGISPQGHPVLHRPELEVDEQDRLLRYLDSAPVVISERRFETDRLAAPPVNTIPVAFHTDGTWVWPAAVNFYLREYGIAPEPELTQHIQATGFSVPEVTEQTLQAARAAIRPPSTPPRPSPAPAMAAGGPAAPLATPPSTTPPRGMPLAEANADPEYDLGEPLFEKFDAPYHEQPSHQLFSRTPEPHEESAPLDDAAFGSQQEQPNFELDSPVFLPEPSLDPSPPTVLTSPVTPPGAPDSSFLFAPSAEESAFRRNSHEEQEPPAPETSNSPLPFRDDSPTRRVPANGQRPEQFSAYQDSSYREPGYQESAYQEPEPTTAPPLGQLQNKLDELGVSAEVYRVGGPIEHGWSLEETDNGWRVGWYDGELTNPAMFGDAEDAAAFMLGKLLLGTGGVSGAKSNSPDLHEEHASDPVESPQQRTTLFAAVSPEIATGSRMNQDLDDLTEPTGGPPITPAMAMDLPRRGEPGPRPSEQNLAQNSSTHTASAPHAPDTVEENLELAEENLEWTPSENPEQGSHPEILPTVAPIVPALPPLVPPVVAPHHRQDQAPPPHREEPSRPPSATPSDQRQSANNSWPIKPMAGEPPLTLFRGKELRELPIGTEIDRFGGTNGNLTYAAGTPFEERSLVPEWISRPYHVYRVQRPLEVLAGVAIPWFNQPGNGVSYLLPNSVEDLLAEGALLELEPGESPS